MAITNADYFAMFPLQEYLVDKDTGGPLSGGIIYFWEDEANTVPKSVFIQDQSPGPTYTYVDIGSQVTLSSVGTTQYLGTDSIIFLLPFDANGDTQLYYISVYSATGTLQFTRNAWPPNVPGGSSTSSFSQSENIVSNPQFARVLFDSVNGATINVTGSGTVTNIAPDWDVITTGSGSITVSQIPVTDTGAPGLPAFALEITSSGLSGNIILSQTISMSPRLLENGFASGCFVAQALAAPFAVAMNYVPSDPALTTVELCAGTVGLGSYQQIKGTEATPTPASNSDSGLVGNIKIQLAFPAQSQLIITCVQVIGVANTSISLDYIQESTPRQIDHLFHYYQPRINFKPISSLLTGWDFPLNPNQFGVTSFTTSSKYVWDQTIMCSAANTVNVSRNSSTGALALTTTVDTEAFYLLQYLSGPQAFETTLSRLAVNISAFQLVHTDVSIKVYLYQSNSSGSIPTSGSGASIGTIATTGVFTLTSANWAAIPQLSGAASTATMGISTGLLDFGFNLWNGSANFGTSTAANFAIVVTFTVPTSGTSVNIQSISCVPGDIPTRPAPQTTDEVLRECRYYWETTFLPAATVPSAVTGGQLIAPMVGTNNSVPDSDHSSGNASSFGYNWLIPKRTAPTLTFYSGTSTTAAKVQALGRGTSTQITAEISTGTFWASISATINGFQALVAASSAIVTNVPNAGNAVPIACWIQYHFTSDARLGVVA